MALRIGPNGVGYLISIANGSIAKAIASVPYKNLTWVGIEKNVRIPDGQPYTLEAIVQGNVITTFVNSTKIAEYKDTANTFQTGAIRFNCRFDAEIRFRKVEIKELPTK
jgi:hypothetical protein